MKVSTVKRLIVLLLTTAIVFSLTACSKPAANPDPTPTAPPATEKPADNEEIPTDSDRYGKYDPPIKMTQVIALGTHQKFREGEDINNNVWIQSYLEDLGIELTYDWAVDGSEYGEKLSLAITTDNLPDVLTVGAAHFKTLAEEGRIWDITDIFEEYASETTKEIMKQDAVGWKSMHIDGRLMGLGYTDNSAAGAALLWIRNDWLKNLGLEEPKTMQEVLDIAEAFVRMDPDGNGADDTYAFAFNGSSRSFYGFFNAYHAYPGIWIQKDGELVYGGIQPEMKAALAKLQDMYRSGLIDPDFAVNDPGEGIINGKFGMVYGAWWACFANLPHTRVNNPEADWRAYRPMSIDDRIGKAQYSNAVYNYHVVNKDYEHPEAMIKMYNYWFDIITNQTEENLYKYLVDRDDPEIVMYHYINLIGWEPKSKMPLQLWEAIESGDTSNLPFASLETYNTIMRYLEDPENAGVEEWATYVGNGPGGSQSIIFEVGENRGIFNEFYGVPTPMMAEKMPALESMMDEMIINIVLGEPVDNFDRFVEEWKRLGGDEITYEVNEWYKRNK